MEEEGKVIFGCNPLLQVGILLGMFILGNIICSLLYDFRISKVKMLQRRMYQELPRNQLNQISR